jgi:hypothetical protein
LHCAYAAIGIQPGDEIITPPITFVATQATAALLGANVIFADVQPDTANIDPIAAERAVTSRTKAIVAVDYAGHPADLSALRELADRKGIFLIEDAAHSLGSMYRGFQVGSIADITINRPSNQPLLNQAVRRIAQLSAPFAPFPADMARHIDQLVLTRTWQFVNGALETGQP